MSKRHNDHISLRDILNEFVEENKLQQGLDKANVQQAWKELMGNGVNSYTTAVTLKDKTLHVSLTSAVLREELSYGKAKIIKLINDHLGKELITTIKLH